MAQTRHHTYVKRATGAWRSRIAEYLCIRFIWTITCFSPTIVRLVRLSCSQITIKLL